MQKLEDRFLDNLILDSLMSISILTICGYALYLLVRFWKVSFLPLAVILPSLIGVGLSLYVPLSPLYVPSDGEYYQYWGYSLAEAWLSGEPMDSPEQIWPGKGLWPLIIGTFSALVGPVTITLIVFNALTVVLSGIVLQKTTLIWGGRSPRWSMVIVFLTSSPFLLWGPSLLREAIFWLGISLGVLALAYATVHRTLPAFLAVGISATVLLGIRPDAGIVLVYGFVAMLLFLFGIVGHDRSRLRAAITSLVLLFLVLSFPNALEFARGAEVTGGTILTSTRSLAAENVTTSFGGPSEPSEPSEPFQPSEPSQPSERWCESEFALMSAGPAVLCSAAVHMPYALFGPFHWEYGPEAIWLISGASTLHFLVLGGLSTYYLLISKGRRWPLLALLGVASASLVMFSSTLTNYGILIRFRAATEVMLIPLALSGALDLVARWKSSRQKTEKSEPPKNV